MTASVDINAALVTAFQGTLAYPVGYEAHDFTPPDNAPWCGLFVLPASTMPAALGDKSPLEHVGIL